MMRRASLLLGGGMVEYHEWHLHEPMLINYEGWRILDNIKMTPLEAWVTDAGGIGRHLDPIIDDPRLNHRQRVCRLYRWSLKELKAYYVKLNAFKFNLAYKIVRQRFEKYRYVTDPAMCDLMVRETQKYLREVCNPHFMRNDHRNPGAPQMHTHPMFHPDNALCYDPWVPFEVMLYDDAKVHRYAAHHPMNSGSYEQHERYGDIQEFGLAHGFQNLFLFASCFFYAWSMFVYTGLFYDEHAPDPRFEELNKYYSTNLRMTIEQEERRRRQIYATSLLSHNWDRILGRAYPKLGDMKWWPQNYNRSRASMDVDPVHKGTASEPYPIAGVGYDKYWEWPK